MERNTRKKQAGFSTVELLVSTLLASMVMSSVYGVYRFQLHSVKAQQGRLEAQEYARSVMDMMVREIRNAGLNPTGTTSGPGCGGIPGVRAATAGSLNLTYDYRGDLVSSAPDGDCNDPDEQITYAFDTSGCPSAGDVLRNSLPLTDCNITSLDLKYFKQDNSDAAGDLPAIRRVLITLTVQSKNADVEFGGNFTVTLSSNVDMRNRGLS